MDIVKRRSNKEKFIKEAYSNESTQATYISYLVDLEPFEELYNKDFGEFNGEETLETLNALESKSKSSILSKLACYKRYHDWAVIVGINKTEMNPMRNLDSNIIKKRTINDNEFVKGIITKEWLYNLKTRLEADVRVPQLNYQDIVALFLVYMGVCGKRLNEVIDLKWSNIDFENKKINVTNTIDNSLSRIINIDEDDIQILKEIKKEEVYYRHISVDSRKEMNEFAELESSDFVIKNIVLKHGKDKTKEIKQTIIMNRLSAFKNELDGLDLEEFPTIKVLSPVQVKKSAQLEMLDNMFSKIEDKKEREKAIDTDMSIYAAVRKKWGDVPLNEDNLQNTIVYRLREDYIRYLKLKKEM